AFPRRREASSSHRSVRGRVAHTLIDMIGKGGEVVDEKLHELVRGAIVLLLVGPGGTRIEDRAVDTGNAHRHIETEVRVPAEFSLVQAAVERGVEQRARR